MGVSGSKGVKITKTRTGPAILSSRSNVARATKAGQRYTVSAYVRTSQPGLRGRVVLRETANGHALKNSAKAFRATRAWRKVSFDTTARRAGSTLNVRVVATRLKRHKALLVDNVVRAPVGLNTPGNPPPPPPDRCRGQADQRLRLQHARHPRSCAAYLGSAYNSNTDPTSWENVMGQNLGIRRTYWGGCQVDKAVSVAKADLAKDRLPWISFKLPYGWADMAAGKGDAWTSTSPPS